MLGIHRLFGPGQNVGYSPALAGGTQAHSGQSFLYLHLGLFYALAAASDCASCHRIVFLMRRLFLLILPAVAALTGCNFMIADIAVNQGNDVLLEGFEKISVNMSQEEVQELIGPPQIRWNLEDEIWIYYYQRRDSQADQKAAMQIYFADGKVSKFEKLQPGAGSK